MSTRLSVPTETALQHSWMAVIAVGLATFSVVTTEMLPVGLLTPIADTLDISTGTAGLMISLPALLTARYQFGERSPISLAVRQQGSMDWRTTVRLRFGGQAAGQQWQGDHAGLHVHVHS